VSPQIRLVSNEKFSFLHIYDRLTGMMQRLTLINFLSQINFLFQCSFLGLFLILSLFTPAILQAAPANLYTTDPQALLIFRSKLDGTDLKSEIGSNFTASPYGVALDIDNNTVYWTEPGNNSIFKGDLKGQTKSLVTDKAFSPNDIAIDRVAQKLYWVSKFTPASIKRSNVDGSNMEDVYVSLSANGPDGIDLDVTAGKIYWTDIFDIAVKRANLDGTNVENVITSLMSTEMPDLALDIPNGKVYWLDGTNTNIQRANMDGSSGSPVTVISLGVNPLGLAIDSTVTPSVAYWTELQTSQVRKLSLSVGGPAPTAVTILGTGDGLNAPTHLALGDFPPLTPITTIDAPPGVGVDSSNKTVTLTFEDFSGALIESFGAFALTDITGQLVNKTPQVRYQATITNKTNSKIKKIVTKNTQATRKLPVGTYSANYVAHVVVAKGKKKNLKKKAKIKAQLAALKNEPNTIENQNKKEVLKANKKLAGFKVKSTTEDSPTTPAFDIN